MTDLYEHIGDYIADKLSRADRIRFEQAMTEDPELKRAVENHEIFEETLNVLVEDDIRSVIHGLDNKTSVEYGSDKGKGMQTFLRVAAVMVFLALAAYIIKKYTKPPNPEILYAQYYSEYISLDIRGSDKDLASKSPCEQGHALMEDNMLREAQLTLESSFPSEDNCTDKSQWLLTLIYLVQNNEVKRDSLINIIKSDQNSPYRSRAEDLFRDLY